MIPDKSVVKIIQDCEKYKGEFEEQFNIAKYLPKSGGGTSTAPPPEGTLPFESKEEKEKEESKETESPSNEKSVSADDLADEIDLGF